MATVEVSAQGVDSLPSSDFEELYWLVRARKERETAGTLATLVRRALEADARPGGLLDPAKLGGDRPARVEFDWEEYGNGRFYTGKRAVVVLSSGRQVDYRIENRDIDSELAGLSDEVGADKLLVLDLETGSVEQALPRFYA